MAKNLGDRVGGTAQQQRAYFDEVIAKYPERFWVDGCAPTLVRNHVISFRAKAGAKPEARQPIPASPYDDLRVEFHIEHFAGKASEDQHPEGRVAGVVHPGLRC